MAYKSFMGFELSNQLVISQNEEEKGQEAKVFFKKKKDETLFLTVFMKPRKKSMQIFIKLAFQQKNYHQQKYKITELERWLNG